MKKLICDRKFLTKFENTNYDKKNLKTPTVTKLKNLNFIKNSNCDKTQIVMLFENSNFDETELKL